jgi:hypothetical protein
MSDTPGTDAAIAARLPWSAAAIAPGALSTPRSDDVCSCGVPIPSRCGGARRLSLTRTGPRFTTARDSVTLTTMAVSPVRRAVTFVGAYPSAVIDTVYVGAVPGTVIDQ